MRDKYEHTVASIELAAQNLRLAMKMFDSAHDKLSQLDFNIATDTFENAIDLVLLSVAYHRDYDEQNEKELLNKLHGDLNNTYPDQNMN